MRSVAIPLALFLLRVVRRLRRRKSEERRAVAEGNLRKARRLYEEAFGKGDLSMIDVVIAEGFVYHVGQRRGPEGFKRSAARNLTIPLEKSNIIRGE